jgi:uncharacterized cupredoxin-like copper-binding protein
LLVVAVAALMLSSGAASAAPSKKVAPIKISVAAGEFYFKFSKASISKPGTVIFTVTNKGSVQHNFVLSTLGKHTKLLQPGQKQTLTVVFKKKGSYAYLCSVPRHASEGMAGSFIVK